MSKTKEFFIQEQFIDLEAQYYGLPSDNKILLNNLNYLSVEHRELLPKLIKNTIKDDIVSLVPTCQCTETANFSDINAVCPNCETRVMDMFANFSPVLWLKGMEGLPKFISPMFLLELDRIVNIQVQGDGAFSMVRWFSDKQYDPDMNIASRQLIDVFRNDPNVTRTYSWFAINIEFIITKLIMFTSSSQKVAKLKLLKEVYLLRKDIIHTEYLPYPHKKFMIHERTALGNYIQGSIPYLMDSALLFMKYKDDDKMVYKERAIGRVLSFLTKAYINIINDFLAQKEGGFRKNIYGLRADYTLRAVIVPIIGKHIYDEIHYPWKASIELFKYHIINILFNRYDMLMNEIDELLANAQVQYIKIIDDVLKILLKESKDGIGTVMWRNPSQSNASILALRITHFKTDVDDETLSISLLVMPLMNADVDGDNCNTYVPQDNYMFELMEPLKPHNTVSSVSPNPQSTFGKIGVPDTVTMALTNIINNEKKGLVK